MIEYSLRTVAKNTKISISNKLAYVNELERYICCSQEVDGGKVLNTTTDRYCLIQCVSYADARTNLLFIHVGICALCISD